MRSVETITIKQIAKMTGASRSAISQYAQKAGWTENGKETRLNEDQVTAIIEAMKKPVSSGAKANLAFEMRGIETSKSRALRIELLHKEIEAVLQEEITSLQAENSDLKITLDNSRDYFTIKRVEIETGRKYSWKPLKDYSQSRGFAIEKAFDQNYGEINSYHRDVWHAVYGLEL